MCSPASEMSGGKHLLMFTVFLLLETCQSKPQVTMSPELKEIFSGDAFYLNCNNGGSRVKWYFNDIEKHGVNETWKIAVAFPTHSGSYRCESNGEKSDNFNIEVNDLAPKASLTVETGHPVMQVGHSVLLQLHSDDGLVGWMCHVYRESIKQRKKVKLGLKNNNTVDFQTAPLRVPETIYWCSDETEQTRSNQIILRASARDVSLEMYPQPAVLGESLALRCLVWGTNQITDAVFYKDNKIIQQGPKSNHNIPVVTESTQGKYRCDATYTYRGHTDGPPYKKDSEAQDVFVQDAPIRAVLSENKGLMSCSCSKPACQSYNRCYWYHKTNGGPVEHVRDWTSCTMTPQNAGSYACRAVWDNKMSALSAAHSVSGPPSNPGIIIAIIIFLVLAALICFGIAFYKYKKAQRTQNQIYEDIPMREREYDVLLKGSDGKREGEYDTLQPQAPDKDKTTGTYEALKKGGAKDEVYHTLGEGAAAQEGEGGYEALKKQGVKDEVYHTLKGEGMTAQGGDGGYEALKKQQGEKEGVYHTLKAEVVAAEGGDGGYEALKKEGMKEGEYDTLKPEQKEEGKAGEQ